MSRSRVLRVAQILCRIFLNRTYMLAVSAILLAAVLWARIEAVDLPWNRSEACGGDSFAKMDGTDWQSTDPRSRHPLLVC